MPRLRGRVCGSVCVPLRQDHVQISSQFPPQAPRQALCRLLGGSTPISLRVPSDCAPDPSGMPCALACRGRPLPLVGTLGGPAPGCPLWMELMFLAVHVRCTQPCDTGIRALPGGGVYAFTGRFRRVANHGPSEWVMGPCMGHWPGCQGGGAALREGWWRTNVPSRAREVEWGKGIHLGVPVGCPVLHPHQVCRGISPVSSRASSHPEA